MRENNKRKSVFASRLRYLRRQCGITQKEIAQSMNIDRSTYAYYETDRTNPDLNTLRRLALIFQVSTDYLLGIEDQPVSTGIFRDNEPSFDPETKITGSLSSLTDDERLFILLYRQLDDQQKEAVQAFAMDSINSDLPQARDEEDSESNE